MVTQWQGLLLPATRMAKNSKKKRQNGSALEIGFGGLREWELNGNWGRENMSKLHFPASLAAR